MLEPITLMCGGTFDFSPSSMSYVRTKMNIIGIDFNMNKFSGTKTKLLGPKTKIYFYRD